MGGVKGWREHPVAAPPVRGGSRCLREAIRRGHGHCQVRHLQANVTSTICCGLGRGGGAAWHGDATPLREGWATRVLGDTMGTARGWYGGDHWDNLGSSGLLWGGGGCFWGCQTPHICSGGAQGTREGTGQLLCTVADCSGTYLTCSVPAFLLLWASPELRAAHWDGTHWDGTGDTAVLGHPW